MGLSRFEKPEEGKEKPELTPSQQRELLIERFNEARVEAEVAENALRSDPGYPARVREQKEMELREARDRMTSLRREMRDLEDRYDLPAVNLWEREKEERARGLGGT